jgi:hypothetical protein
LSWTRPSTVGVGHPAGGATHHHVVYDRRHTYNNDHHLTERWERKPPKAAVGPNPNQQQWLTEHVGFEVVVDGRSYSEQGVLSSTGRYFAGNYRVVQNGYLRVGVLQLTRRQRQALAARAKRAAVAADPEAHAEFCARRQKWWHASKARLRQLAKRRQKYREQVDGSINELFSACRRSANIGC